jgi:hypothetical protein
MAFSTTSRESSTQQSEYSNPMRGGSASAAPPDGPQVDRSRAGQDLAAAEMVVEEQAEADHPARPQAAVVGQHEAQRPDEMRRGAQQHLALDQLDQPEL